MKTFSFFFLLLVSVAFSRAQSSTNTPLTKPATNAPALKQAATNAPSVFQPNRLSVQLSREIQPSAIEPLQPKPNEIQLGKTTASGIAVEAAKTKQPLKLVHPISPPTNSSPEDNVVRDPFNGKVNGLKVFAIHF